MPWLSFLHGGVVIIEASSLIHARTLAALRELGRVSHVAEGHFIDPEPPWRTTPRPAPRSSTIAKMRPVQKMAVIEPAHAARL
jgi:hypothetical protein